MIGLSRMGCAHTPFVETLVKLIECGANLVKRGGARRTFFEFQDEYRSFPSIGERAQSRVPVDGPVEGEKVLVFFAMIVMEVHRDDPLAHELQTRGNAAAEVRVSDIEAEAQID